MLTRYMLACLLACLIACRLALFVFSHLLAAMVTLGTTKKGTICKNCIKKGGLCATHASPAAPSSATTASPPLLQWCLTLLMGLAVIAGAVYVLPLCVEPAKACATWFAKAFGVVR